MRFLLLTAIIGVLSLLALFRPRIGVYGYVWYAVMRPDVLAFVTTTNYFSTILAICTIMGSLPYVFPKIDTIFKSKICLGLMLFMLVGGLSTAFAVDPSLAVMEYWPFVRSTAVLMLIPILIENKEQATRLLLVCAGSIGFLGVKYGLFGLLHTGVRYNQGYGSVADNNFLALALAVAVPLCWYSAFLVSNNLLRLSLWGAVFCCMVGVVLTYSRGGALAMGTGLLIIAWNSKHKLLLAAVMAVFSLPAIYIAGEAYLDRLSTIKAPTDEASAASRLYLFKIGMHIWKDHPLLGVGFGRSNQQLVMPQYYPLVIDNPAYTHKVLHDSYVQILVDCGIGGLAMFIFLLYGSIFSMRRSARRLKESDPETRVIPLTIQSCLVVFAVGCTFLSAVDNFALFYVLLLAAAAWERIEAGTQRPWSPPVGVSRAPRRVAVPSPA